jgi:hypothetical protein
MLSAPWVALASRLRDKHAQTPSGKTTGQIDRSCHMDLAALTSKVQEALAGGTGFTNKVKFDFGLVGKLFIDGAAGKATNEDGAADATVSVSFDDFQKLAQGALDPTMAFMQGKLKVAGDMGVAMKLQSLFSKLK